MKIENKFINKSIEEVLLDRLGKVVSPEFYSSKTQFLIMYPNKYSLLVTARGRTKFSDINIYNGIVDVTSLMAPDGLSKKVRRKVIEDLMVSLSKIEVVNNEVLSENG